MLYLELRTIYGVPRSIRTERGTIKCLDGGPAADFRIALEQASGGVPVQAVLRHYPRWAEPLTALTARCLALIASYSDCVSPEDFRLVTLSISLGQSLIDEIYINPLDESMCCQEWWRLATAAHVPLSLWALMQRRLVYEVWGDLDPPPIPKQVRVPVYNKGSTTYCRSRDLPPSARDAFERWQFGRAAPSIPDVDDAVYPHDIEVFLW